MPINLHAASPSSSVSTLGLSTSGSESAAFRETSSEVKVIARRYEALTEKGLLNRLNKALRISSVSAIGLLGVVCLPVTWTVGAILDDQLKSKHTDAIANAFRDLYKTSGETYESFERICKRIITCEAEEGRVFFKKVSKSGKGKIGYLMKRLALQTASNIKGDGQFDKVKREIYKHFSDGCARLKLLKPDIYEMLKTSREGVEVVNERYSIVDGCYHDALKDVYIIGALSLYNVYRVEKNSACAGEGVKAKKLIDERLSQFDQDLGGALKEFNESVAAYYRANGKDAVDGLKPERPLKPKFTMYFQSVVKKALAQNNASGWDVFLTAFRENRAQAAPASHLSKAILK